MKKILLTSILIISAVMLFGQASFSDNFESYPVGATVAQSSPNWELWPSAVAVDAPVTDERSVSGSNSLLLQGGGDVDIILPFDETYSEGALNMTMQMFVPEGRQSYFNFQGESPAGQVWVLECFFRPSGIFEVNRGTGGGAGFVIQNRYPQGEWFNINIDINLTENLWRIFIDGECFGSFSNIDTQNQVASINLFPDDNNSLTFIDDVRWTYNPTAAPVDVTLDASYIGAIDGAGGPGILQNQFFGISGTEQQLDVVVGNSSQTPIETFTLSLETATESISENFVVSLPEGEATVVSFSEGIALANGNESGTITIGNVNGADDQNTCNNTGPINLIGFSPAVDKKVWVEALTASNICAFCPENLVYMNYMSTKYPDLFVGSNVHLGSTLENFDWVGEQDDPNTPNNEGSNLGELIGGLRLPIVDRTSLSDDWASVESDFMNSITSAPFMTLTHGAQWDGTTRTLDVNVTTDFSLVPLTNGRLVVALIEDGIIGSDPSLDQSNAYGSGLFGPMGGFENLPDPVPANQVTYNQVARVLFTNFQGLEDAYVGTTNNSENHVFSMELPVDWAVQNLSIISAFINDDGTVGNAQIATVEDAIGNGFTSTIDPVLDASISIAPNPAREYAEITINLDEPTEMVMSLGDAMGRIITTNNYGTLSGTQKIGFDTSDLSAGIYYLRFGSGNAFTTKRLIITE